MQEQGISLDFLEIPDDFTEPTDWDLGLVAEVDGHIIGMVRLTELDSDLVALDQVSVHPSMSHQGIGRALLLATADLCRKRGYTAVTGTTFREVVFNAHFCAALGAIKTRTRTRRWPAGAGSKQTLAWTPSVLAPSCASPCESTSTAACSTGRRKPNPRAKFQGVWS